MKKLGIIGDEVQLAGAQELATYLEKASTLKKLIPVMNDMAAQQYGYNATAESTASIATMLGKVMNGQVNELRISRGVLPPSEFMRIGASGFCMLIR